MVPNFHNFCARTGPPLPFPRTTSPFLVVAYLCSVLLWGRVVASAVGYPQLAR